MHQPQKIIADFQEHNLVLTVGDLINFGHINE